MIWSNDNQNFNILWLGESNFQFIGKSMEKYVVKEIGQLKAGDIFRYKSSTDFIEKPFRVVDKEDYKKVFGKKYPYGDYNDILAYCESENRFTHFGPSDKVSVPRQLIPLKSLKPYTDFEYENGRYYFNNYDFKYAYCVRLDKKENDTRNASFDLNTMVYPLY